ncbi:MAG: lipid-A-disaccharide synthase [Devosia sp.]
MASARIFLVAGEPSGDRLGADLVERLARRASIEPSGVGGPELARVGLSSLFPMSDLAVMGWRDVLLRYPLLYRRMRQTVRAIRSENPDIVVFIDAQVFSQTVAQTLRKSGYKGTLLLYVAPSVWAWKPERARVLKPLFDEVMAVLPFEPKVMKELSGPPTSYVGHAAARDIRARSMQPDRGPLLLLPGSRSGEIGRHLPLMRATAEAVRGHARVSGLVLLTVASQVDRIKREVRGRPDEVSVVSGADAARRAFDEAVAAVAVSGTITLELALAGVPMVVTYIGDRGQLANREKYRVPFVGLPNIVVGRELVPEVLLRAPETGRLVANLRRLLDDSGAMEAQEAGFAEIRRKMREGEPGEAPVDPAERVLAYLR